MGAVISLLEENIVVFIHIFKTGGNTLTNIIERQFDPEVIYSRKGNEVLSEARSSLKTYRYLTGHYPYSVKQFLTRHPIFCTMLRHPVDRVLSLYGYARSQNTPGLVHDIAKSVSINEFIDHPKILTRISNVMTLFMAAKPEEFLYRKRKMNSEDLSLALSRLTGMPFIGVTEKFNESVQLLKHTFDWKDNLPVEAGNITPNPVERHQTSDSLVQQIRSINELDFELYHHGREIFLNRLTSIL